MRFYLLSALALVVFYVITLTMEPNQAVTGVRVGIGFGLALAAVKMILRHYNIGRPPRR
jgi:hypothetical protein